MKWLRKNADWAESDAGYRITMVACQHVAWPPLPGNPPKFGNYDWRDYVHTAIGYFPGVGEDAKAAAKRACEDHFKNREVAA